MTSMMETVFSYNNLVHAVSGATGGFVSLTIFYPLDLVRTRLQVDDKLHSKSTYSVVTKIAKEEGISSLYNGLFPVVVTFFCSNFVYFYAYTSLKTIVLETTGKPDPFKDLICAFISGVINVLATTPLWVSNTRLKLQGTNLKANSLKDLKKPRYTGLIDCIGKIYKQEGIKALWDGTVPSIILAANPSIVFMVYELLKRYMQHLTGKTELSGLLYFLIGAVAKSVATVMTYPLQVLQSRLRVGLNTTENMFSSLMQMLKTSGVSGLYKGMETKLLQTVSTAALMFLTYEKIAAFIFQSMGVPHKG